MLSLEELLNQCPQSQKSINCTLMDLKSRSRVRNLPNQSVQENQETVQL